MLTKYLSPDRVRVHVTVDDWPDAVRAAGGLLVHAGLCKPRYVDAMINAIRQMGPYMVLAPGLALIHARPKDGVTAIGMSLVTLDPPVDFGSEHNDPVSLVIAFGAMEKKRHMDMLQELAMFLEDPARRGWLVEAVSVEQVMRLIRWHGRETGLDKSYNTDG